MKFKTTPFIAFLLFFNCKNNFNSDLSRDTLKYSISKIQENKENYLKVYIENKTGDDGKTSYSFPDEKWGEKNLYNTIKDFSVLNTEAKVIFEKDSNEIYIQHPKELKTLKISYKIKQDTDSILSVYEAFRPVITSKGFSIFGHNLFIIPKHYYNNNKKLNIRLSWENFPKNYNIVTSFGAENKEQTINNISKNKFTSSKFVGGDYRKHIFKINGNKVAFAIKDHWNFKDSTIVNILKKTIKSQRDFWQDHSQDYFSITLSPSYEENYSSFLGTGLTNSFSTIATNNNQLNINSLTYLFNHELQHNWNGHTILKENEEEQYWFSEGFTDYYTIKNIAKNRINNLDVNYFIDEFNIITRKLHTSPVKEAPNSEINYDNFWSNMDYEKLPYRRGAIFAFYMDQKIKKETENKYSLDDVMLHIKNEAVKKGQKINNNYFVSVIKELFDIDITTEFDTYIEKGKLINLTTFFKNYDFDYSPTSFVFDKGFTFTEDRKQIKTIDKNSNAYKAGLRKGDSIKPLQYDSNNYNLEAKIKVITNKTEKIITYLPKKEIKTPTLLKTEKNLKKLNF